MEAVTPVIPAKAGIPLTFNKRPETPAFAGAALAQGASL